MGAQCPECGADWGAGVSCEQAFFQMLYWENEQPALGEVHHLMVLCYYLQHPSRLSPEGLENQIRLLHRFVAEGVSPAQARRSARRQVDSGQREWKITARPGRAASYPRPMHWHMTAVDVVAGGSRAYLENVRRWAGMMDEEIGHA